MVDVSLSLMFGFFLVNLNFFLIIITIIIMVKCLNSLVPILA